MCTRTSYVPGMEYSAGNQIHSHRHVIQLYDITYPVHLGIIPTISLLFVTTIFLSAALVVLEDMRNPPILPTRP